MFRLWFRLWLRQIGLGSGSGRFGIKSFRILTERKNIQNLANSKIWTLILTLARSRDWL